jgi:hypothetical protein
MVSARCLRGRVWCIAPSAGFARRRLLLEMDLDRWRRLQTRILVCQIPRRYIRVLANRVQLFVDLHDTLRSVSTLRKHSMVSERSLRPSWAHTSSSRTLVLTRSRWKVCSGFISQLHASSSFSPWFTFSALFQKLQVCIAPRCSEKRC